MGTIRSFDLKPMRGITLGAPGGDPWLVGRTDPATSVMTDFHVRSAVTVRGNSPIDTALEHMKHVGVRAAFVIGDDGKNVLGFITAYDIQGEKPIRHLQAVGSNHLTYSRDDVLVQDIMEEVAEWQAADMKDVERSTIETILGVLNKTGRTHIVVVEMSEDQGARLRGLFSAAKIMRLLKS